MTCYKLRLYLIIYYIISTWAYLTLALFVIFTGHFIVLRRQKETTEGTQETVQGNGWSKCFSLFRSIKKSIICEQFPSYLQVPVIDLIEANQLDRLALVLCLQLAPENQCHWKWLLFFLHIYKMNEIVGWRIVKWVCLCRMIWPSSRSKRKNRKLWKHWRPKLQEKDP